jgi:tyrosinase
MHFTNAAAAVSLLAVSAHAWTPSPTEGLAKLEEHHAGLDSYGSCNSGNAAVRKEWLTLSDDEKIAYTDAVKCLMELPSLSGDAIPGAKSRFDDFVGVHINQTPFIHATVSQ